MGCFGFTSLKSPQFEFFSRDPRHHLDLPGLAFLLYSFAGVDFKK